MSETTAVGERLMRRIALTGPISVAEYMAACLTDPDGYYATQPPFGVAGDFITAPDISQMFGELVGAWLIDRWHADGRPAPFDLVELGPGRGTLMADIFRVARNAPGFLDAARVVLVEASPALRETQRKRLAPLHTRLTFAPEVPTERPIYLVANEFFDALPIRQFVRRGSHWFERTVGVADGGLAFGLSPMPTPTAINHAAPEGAVHEVRPAATALIDTIARHIAGASAGAALVIDYGHLGGVGGETLQAVRAHKAVDVLTAPGEADLSSHVDFGALAQAARTAGAVTHGPVGQGAFLLALGLLERAGQLGSGKDAAEQAAITAVVERLAGDGPGAMGTLFKVLALTASEDPPLGLR